MTNRGIEPDLIIDATGEEYRPNGRGDWIKVPVHLRVVEDNAQRFRQQQGILRAQMLRNAQHLQHLHFIYGMQNLYGRRP